jgi:phosphoribosyl 1,2-cyclic phosphate phosphodiesterase
MVKLMSNKTKITVLGCGGSGGVPYAGNVWGKCDPNNLKNHRLRPSVLVQKGDTNIVIDTGPDFRQQMNRANLQGLITAVLYTHAHVDHVMGMDDLRAFFVRNGRTPVPVYATLQTFQRIKEFFHYAFVMEHPMYPPIVQENLLPEILKIGGLEFTSFDQIHGDLVTKGFRIGDFAYCTDVNDLTIESLNKLTGIKTWIVGAFYSPEGQTNHAGINKITEWVEFLKPEMTYLTHLTSAADYDTMCRELPPHIRPAYDGLELFIE